MDENALPIRKYYCVFNGDIIEGKRAFHKAPDYSM